METINLILDFFFSWKGYFIMMPIWLIIIILFIKLSNRELFQSDIMLLMAGWLFNPILTILTMAVIVSSPFVIISFYVEGNRTWKEIGGKKLF